MGNEREEVIELHLWEAKFNLFRTEASLSMDSFQNPVRGALVILYSQLFTLFLIEPFPKLYKLV